MNHVDKIRVLGYWFVMHLHGLCLPSGCSVRCMSHLVGVGTAPYGVVLGALGSGQVYTYVYGSGSIFGAWLELCSGVRVC